MKNLREEKGITLVALIITIVVLLILATVAISSIQNENILQYATNAGTVYNNSVKNEGVKLNEYINYLDKYASKPTKPEAKTISFELVGLDSMNFDGIYSAKEGMTWREWCDGQPQSGVDRWNIVNEQVTGILVDDYGEDYPGEYYILEGSEGSERVNPDDVIEGDRVYYWMTV